MATLTQVQIPWPHAVGVGNVVARHHQQVRRRRWPNVWEDQQALILRACMCMHVRMPCPDNINQGC
eukprot:359159-Chlamydomonas_euryale.AAC.16